MIWNIGDNIVSPLGWTSEENWLAVANGESGLQFHNDLFQLPEPFFGSYLNEQELEDRFRQISRDQHFTKCEKMAILSVADAVACAGIDAASPEVIFVISTTKGNVELLENLAGFEENRPYLWRMAQVISQFFGNKNAPIVVSNACISGCAAQITADRLLSAGRYHYAVVLGVDCLSKFVVSGFQSFKALSPELCRPFDAERTGLNLGEAAATIVYSAAPIADAPVFVAGALCNDANHISAPSRTAEGLVKAMKQTFEQIEDFDTQQIAFVSAHGTATRYNDDMESVAMERAGLQQLPINSLKGYFGHTLGAAGVLETIISVRELRAQKILPTRGCQTPGTVAQLNVVTQFANTDKSLFVKIISGFGGSNAVMCVQLPEMGKPALQVASTAKSAASRCVAEVVLNNRSIQLDGETIWENVDNSNTWLSDIYHKIGMEYPKFFKMDRLCKAGTLAAELLMRKCGKPADEVKEDWATVCLNSAGSLDDDRDYQQTIQSSDNFFPSPSVFVYTLSNIVTGEIAIRHKIKGESSCYVMEQFDYDKMQSIVTELFSFTPAKNMLIGWVDYDGGRCDVRIFAFEKEKPIQ